MQQAPTSLAAARITSADAEPAAAAAADAGGERVNGRSARVLFLVLGSRGDVQPLALLAWHLQEQLASAAVTFATHAAHAAWLAALLPNLCLGAGLPHAPGALWHGHAAAVATDAPEAREAVISAVCAGLGLDPPPAAARDSGRRTNPSVDSGAVEAGAAHGARTATTKPTTSGSSSSSSSSSLSAQCNASPGSAGGNQPRRLLVFNLFALEGYHLAEALGVPCIAAHPYPIPYPCPAAFDRRFAAAYPELHSALQDAGSDCVGWKEVSARRQPAAPY